MQALRRDSCVLPEQTLRQGGSESPNPFFCRHRPTEFCQFGALCDDSCISLTPVKRLLWSRARAGNARRRGPRAGWEDACVGRSLLMYCVGDTDREGDLFFRWTVTDSLHPTKSTKQKQKQNSFRLLSRARCNPHGPRPGAHTPTQAETARYIYCTRSYSSANDATRVTAHVCFSQSRDGHYM